MRLVSKRIPESYPEVVKIRPARIVVVYGVSAAEVADRNHREIRQRAADADARPRFHEIRPILALRVRGGVDVPIPLKFPDARAVAVAGAVLRVQQPVVLE